MKLFGTDGIRGKVGTFLTPNLALEVGMSAGQVLGQIRPRSVQGKDLASNLGNGSAHPTDSKVTDSKVILMGQDSRTSGNMLAAAIAAGLTAAGWDVWQLGLCPTPAVAYLTAEMPEIAAGVMISASHNPPEDNGIKFFGADGSKLPASVQQSIEDLMATHQSNYQNNIGGNSLPLQGYGQNYHRHNLLENYQVSLQDSIGTSLEGLKIVLDMAWGSATKVSAAVFTNLGAEVICLHSDPDGNKINVDCGSTHLAPLQQAVHDHQADMGFAFDGDADRVLAIDSQGRVVDGDYILYLWGQELLQQNQLPDASIVTTVMANLGFERAWQKIGGQLVRTAVGDQYVHAEMMKRGAMLGGEQSGHVLCRHYAVSGDGLLTALHLAALAKQRAPLADLMSQSFTPYPQLLKNVRVEDRELRRNWQSCDGLVQAINHAESDLGDRGRVLVRASGTEPLMRVMVEAETMDLANHWTEQLTKAIHHHLLTA